MPKKIQNLVIKRLFGYFEQLTLMQRKHIEYVFSKTLADVTGVTSFQVRRDLSLFGSFGHTRLGYNVIELARRIRNILGMDETHNVAIIGAGNLGSALASYPGFARNLFNVCLIFDQDRKKIGKKIGRLIVESINALPVQLKNHKIEIVVLTLPDENVQDVVNRCIKNGIRYFFSFSSVRLQVPAQVVVQYENTTVPLSILSYHIKNQFGK